LDLQCRQVGHILHFAPDFQQPILQLLLLTIQLHQLDFESCWVFTGRSGGRGSPVKLHEMLLVALHLLVQLLNILILGHI